MSNRKTKELTIDEDALIRFKTLPMFYLSQASKELFHSSFIHWLSTIPQGLGLLREVFNTNELYSVGREKSSGKINVSGRNYIPKADLVGYNNKQEIIFVIENKVKDIPNEQQILNLKKAFGEKISYYILSFIEPAYNYDKKEFIQYKQLIPTFEKHLKNFSNDKYQEGLLKDYINFIKELQNIIDSYKLTGDYDFSKSSNESLRKKLNDVKLWENFQRVSGQSFCNEITDSLRRINGLEEVCSSSGINHQKATINFYLKWKNFDIGVQIEDNQFRRFIYGNVTGNGVLKMKGELLWFTKEYDVVRKKKKAQSNSDGLDFFPFGSYNMKDKGFFFYQYNMEFKKNSSMIFDDILQKIINALTYLLDRDIQQRITSIINKS